MYVIIKQCYILQDSRFNISPFSLKFDTEFVGWSKWTIGVHVPLMDPLFASSNLDFSNLHFSLRLFSIPEIKFSLTLITTELL